MHSYIAMVAWWAVQARVRFRKLSLLRDGWDFGFNSLAFRKGIDLQKSDGTARLKSVAPLVGPQNTVPPHQN